MSESLAFRGPVTAANPTGITELSAGSPLPVAESFGGNLATKSVTFTGAAGLGATGATTRFTVSGVVKMRIFAVCSADLISAGGGTIELGVVGGTATLIAQTVGTAIDANEIWFNATPVLGVTAVTSTPEFIVDMNVTETIGTGAITAGAITYYCLWTPISSGASVVAA